MSAGPGRYACFIAQFQLRFGPHVPQSECHGVGKAEERSISPSCAVYVQCAAKRCLQAISRRAEMSARCRQVGTDAQRACDREWAGQGNVLSTLVDERDKVRGKAVRFLPVKRVPGACISD